MNVGTPCRCCLLRPPEFDLKKPYTVLEKTEVYVDILKECFEIHILSETDDGCQGICFVCIGRLRDAFDFKQQVMRCQKELQARNLSGDITRVGDAEEPRVKEELPDGEEGYDSSYCDVKEELPDLDSIKEPGTVVDILSLDKVKVKRKSERKKDKKRSPVFEKKSDRKKRKSANKILLKKISLNNFEKITDPTESVSENVKYKSNIHNILKYSNCTPFLNKTIAGISCVYCKESHKNIELLSNHYNEKHSRELNENKRYDRDTLAIKIDITDLKCNLCNAKMNVVTNLKEHLINAHNIKFFSDVHDYFLEFKLTDSDIFNCALCHSTFETFKMLLQHMNGHYRNFVCDVCDMGFINNHRLKNHKRTHEVGTFKCAFCDKVFSTRVRQMCHEKYTHNRNARYTTNCPHCDKSFTSYYQRNRHMTKDHNASAATYKCNICDKSFIMKSKLTTHIKKVHLMERNHTCTECGQSFFIKQSLDEHMVKHNGERVFKCTVCHKAYARKKTLTEHMRIHNNDRRFKCGVCGLAFVQKCSMKSHMLSNHGVTLSEFENARSELNGTGND
ncbi:uncharacterized protein [Epargyreus clarus]|uniref:uncharacterized protein n=1 Tax=Epargyreus clarus TaxID=520877 RepID=UPI003C2B0D05